jgi:hypothetical protein
MSLGISATPHPATQLRLRIRVPALSAFLPCHTVFPSSFLTDYCHYYQPFYVCRNLSATTDISFFYTQGRELAPGADASRKNRAAGLSVRAAGPRHHLTNLPLWRRPGDSGTCGSLLLEDARRELPFAMQTRRDFDMAVGEVGQPAHLTQWFMRKRRLGGYKVALQRMNSDDVVVASPDIINPPQSRLNPC